MMESLIKEFEGIDGLVEPGRIAAMILAEIGDVLVVTPALQSIKERYPGAHLTLLVRRHLVQLVEGNPHVDEVIPLDAGSPIRKAKFLLSLLVRRFDIFFDLHTPTFNTCTTNSAVFARNFKIMRFIRSRYKIGYAAPETMDQLTHPIALPTEEQLRSENIVDTTLRVCGGRGSRRFKKMMDVSCADRDWADRWVNDNVKGQFIVCFFGSKQSADIWPLENVQAFITRCLTDYADLAVVHIGGELERAFGNSIQENLDESLGGRFFDLAGQTSLGKSAAIIGKARAFITTDSGPLHIADCLEIPTVAIFSSKNYPTIWAPLYKGSKVVNHPVECGPCFSEECVQTTHACMEIIAAEEVFNALESIW